MVKSLEFRISYGMLRKQNSGEEKIRKMSVVMTIGYFFYVQLSGFDIIDN
ncbi:MAG: hypothetical protein F6K60_19940 [Okeania sp. SIO1F9]|nr:hypothetical protein [Okeania sp. SIO1F9]